jgi:hypothetical protein
MRRGALPIRDHHSGGFDGSGVLTVWRFRGVRPEDFIRGVNTKERTI